MRIPRPPSLDERGDKVSAGQASARPRLVDTLDATAGLSSSAGNTAGQANAGPSLQLGRALEAMAWGCPSLSPPKRVWTHGATAGRAALAPETPSI